MLKTVVESCYLYSFQRLATIQLNLKALETLDTIYFEEDGYITSVTEVVLESIKLLD